MSRFASISWLRTLVWVLVLALPLQVQARAGLLGCAAGGAAHQQMAAMDGHDHMGMAMAAADPAHHHATPAQAGAEAHAAHQCSACAACCIGAALPSAPLALAGPAGHGVQAGAPGPASLEVVAPPLKRPPKPSLA